MSKHQIQAYGHAGGHSMVRKTKRELARDEVRRRAFKFCCKAPTPETIDLDEHRDSKKDSFINTRLKMELLGKKSSETFQKIFETRRNLPVIENGQEILRAIKAHQVTLVVGDKGCGKTTQIPQMLLDDNIFNNRATECRIVCLQTTANKAEEVAKRVAYERDESLENSIGYQAKKKTIAPRENGSILFCTAGVLISKFRNDPFLQKFCAVILDDMHERTSDYIQVMALLSIILPFRPDMNVILLSPYVCTNKIGDYFKHFHTFKIAASSMPMLAKPSSVTTIKVENEIEHNTMPRFNNGQVDSHLVQAITTVTGINSGTTSQQNTSRFMNSHPATTASVDNVNIGDRETRAKEKKAENEYKCSKTFLWMYADSDLSSISEWDRALITKNRQRIISFERKYPHLLSGENDTAMLLEKTKLNNSGPEPAYTQRIERSYRTRADISTSEESVKRAGTDECLPNCAKKPRTLNSLMSDSELQVAIIDWSDPDGNIVPANWLQVEEKLLNEMISSKWSDEVVSFDGSEWSQGVKVVKCGNERSLEFLKVTVASIEPLWPRAQLGVVPRSVLPLRTYVKMWIPPPVPSTRNVFELLGKQNKGLVTGDWQIITTTPCKNDFGTAFRLAIDSRSLKRLNACKGRVRFGFGFINIQAE